ncbi:hypothetical protein AV545_09145 [Paenibacillus jamilae]|uniref:hypothetical protein n=1 Tax=Paenibacillus jamilae TaxID=114136 RepID=UPI0007ABCCA8|nr:hypothetical protein [Paenibacillus jamilae]KZE81634.1 hypothetical protein AV545_09145 [Paenibacillus jamilae]
MECQTNNDPQLLRNSHDEPIMGHLNGVFLRYPHENNDKVKEVCEQGATLESQKVIEHYNWFNEPQMKLHHVNVTSFVGETTTEVDPWTNVSHWQWKGKCDYEIYVTCE